LYEVIAEVFLLMEEQASGTLPAARPATNENLSAITSYETPFLHARIGEYFTSGWLLMGYLFKK
jgi:hypothetical protein